MLLSTTHCLFKSLSSKIVCLGLLVMLAPQVAYGMNTKLLHTDTLEYKTAMPKVSYADYGWTMSSEKSFVKQQHRMHKSSFADESLEVGKIMLLGTAAAVSYGIMHDLITTHICFEYFTWAHHYHNSVTKNSYPWVYRRQNKVLYAFLWGTIATWWVGLPLGGIWGMAARAGSSREKLAWQDLTGPAAVFLGGMLATSLIVGYANYKPGKYMSELKAYHRYEKDADWASSFNMVAHMHNTSYAVGICGGLAMTYYIYHKRKPINQVVQLQPNGFTIDLVALLAKD